MSNQIPDEYDRAWEEAYGFVPVVTILDTVTGATAEVTGPNRWQWLSGNWSCDCNRADYFPNSDAEDNQPESQWGTCLGAKRFLVVKTNDPAVLVTDYNESYDEELVKSYVQTV